VAQMTLIQVACPDCQLEAKLPPGDVRLVCCTHGTLYVWRCDGCGAHVSRPATAANTIRLRDAGVPVLTVQAEHGNGPVITEDDLLRFGLEIEALPSAVR
jgi:hypothetical protein